MMCGKIKNNKVKKNKAMIFRTIYFSAVMFLLLGTEGIAQISELNNRSTSPLKSPIDINEVTQIIVPIFNDSDNEVPSGTARVTLQSFEGEGVELIPSSVSIYGKSDNIESVSFVYSSLANNSGVITIQINTVMPGRSYIYFSFDAKGVAHNPGVSENIVSKVEYCGCNSASDANGQNNEAKTTLSVTAYNLPIHLLDFEAQVVEGGHLLEWTTTNEEFFDRFEVQHSTDGIYFANIAEVPGKGSVGNTVQYDYVNENPELGRNMYRLKMYDRDGSVNYSDVKVLFHSERRLQTRLFIFPNPARRYITVNNPLVNRESLHLQTVIYDNLGRQMIKQVFVSGQLIDVSNLPNGTYFVVVLDQVSTALGAGRFIKIN